MTHPTASPDLNTFVSSQELINLFKQAHLEDQGPDRLDLTSQCFIPKDKRSTAIFRARQKGICAGLAILSSLIAVLDPNQTINTQIFKQDSDPIQPGDALASISGPLQLILGIERIALNILGHLSGIATLTSHYAQQCQGTKANVYDTRKTLPGLRHLQKYAVACGGGKTHRMGLYDAVLIKDNHLAHLAIADYAQALAFAIQKAKSLNPKMAFAMVEVDTLDQLQVTLPVEGVDLILLDNMPPDVLTQAVKLRDQITPQVELEASGGINLKTIGSIAQTGVDRISVGALTHSAPNLDIGLDID